MNRARHGFTTLELLIAMMIVFILVAVALFSLHDHSVEVARTRAWVGMNDLASWMQSLHRQSGSYAVDKLPFEQYPDKGEAVYRFSLARKPIQAQDPAIMFAASDAQGFTLLATPADADDACGILILDQSGRRAVTGTKSLHACMLK